jgi:FkbM family methyltransferase
MVSYAQNYEDVMLTRCFPSSSDGFYIDVGAMDPVNDSVTKHFYDLGWSGINLEPNEFFFGKLMEQRPRDINLNLAAGEEEGCQTFHVFKEYGISTFDSSHRDRFMEEGYQPEDKTVRTTTLAAVCNEYVKREIDFLKVDCEGWETQALKGFDWERFRPTIVVVEATKPLSTEPSWSGWEPILTQNDRYIMAYFDGLNRFYLRREYSDLLKHFQVPPNVFDGFTTFALEDARRKYAEETTVLESRVQELERQVQVQTSESVRLAGLLEEASNSLAGVSAELQGRDATLQKQVDACRLLETKLTQSRLWVGQLSQEMAIMKA